MPGVEEMRRCHGEEEHHHPHSRADDVIVRSTTGESGLEIEFTEVDGNVHRLDAGGYFGSQSRTIQVTKTRNYTHEINRATRRRA